jgi:gliding motility-associated-like protein
MKSVRNILILVLIILAFHAKAQNVVNNGDQIVVSPGAYVMIGGDYINRNDGINDGVVNLDGNIVLKQNWINYANNTVITMIGASPVGNLIMDGTNKQAIDGSNPSHFENLIVRNADKILRVTDCEVNDTLFLDAVLKLNSQKLIIDNPNPDAIKYLSHYILSETEPSDGYGELQWNIGSVLDTFEIPFGSGLTDDNDINVTYRSKTPGQPSDGAMLFATYPADCRNWPLPTGVNSLGKDYDLVVNRYWIIDPLYLTAKPGADITFRYTETDVNVRCNARMNEAELKAISYNTLTGQWNDSLAVGVASPANNLVFAENIAQDNFFAPWALVNEYIPWEIFTPNAFTPNGDGNNDEFRPLGENLELQNFEMYIYDRWGGLVFETTDYSTPWTGRAWKSSQKCPGGVYTWLVYLTDKYGKINKYRGIVTLVP